MLTADSFCSVGMDGLSLPKVVMVLAKCIVQSEDSIALVHKSKYSRELFFFLFFFFFLLKEQLLSVQDYYYIMLLSTCYKYLFDGDMKHSCDIYKDTSSMYT